MKNGMIALLLCLITVGGRAGTMAADTAAVVPVRWERLDLRPLDGALQRQVAKILLNANKYALNKWYGPVKGYAAQQGRRLDFGGVGEHDIRPSATEAFSLAVSLEMGVYDPQVTDVTREQAIARTVRLVGSLAASHLSNVGKGGWGHEWQSAFWASQAATAGWLMWDELDSLERDLLRRMTVSEADRLIGYEVPYYMDLAGKVIFKGDSKAEENAWNSSIMAVATAMMPAHPHWRAWFDKGIELQLSAFARPSDAHRRDVINGMRLCEVLHGSNVDENGIVINHNILHPDYMTTVMHNAVNVWIYALAGMRMPQASLFNGEVVYRTLTGRPVGDGRTMYVRDSLGRATARMYYPQGNDWGGQRQACFLMMDVMAMVFGWEAGCPPGPSEWALARTREMLRMQGRDTTGQYYQQKQEDLYRAREEWIAYHAGFCYLGLWMMERGPRRCTNAADVR